MNMKINIILYCMNTIYIILYFCFYTNWTENKMIEICKECELS